MRKNFLFLLGVCCLMIFPVFAFAEELGDTKSFLNPFIHKLKEIWDKLLGDKIVRLLTFLKEEIFKRKSIFKQELQKEIRELKDELIKCFEKIFKR